MGGLSTIDTLKKGGIDAKKGQRINVHVDDVVIAEEPHPLAHPRANMPLDEKLLADIARKYEVTEDILLRREGLDGGKLTLILVYGSRRTRHLREVVRRAKAGESFTDVDGTFTIPWKEELARIPARFFNGTIGEALLARLAENSDPTKVADAPSVLARTVIQCRKHKCSDKDILARMPREVGLAELEALSRFFELDEEVQARFDNEGVPVGLLSAVLLTKPAERMARINQLVKKGISTTKGASRVMNQEKAQQDAFVKAQAEPGKAPALAPSVERRHPKTLLAIAKSVQPLASEADEAETKVSDALGTRDLDQLVTVQAEYFALGVRYAAGDEKALDEMSDDLRRMIGKGVREATAKPEPAPKTTPPKRAAKAAK